MATAVETKLTVLNPEGYPPKVDARGMAPALETLQGKRLFLVDVGFENSDNFMAQLRGLARGARARRSGRRRCG